MLNLTALLSEINAFSPCGEDCEYDPLFREMEEAAQGKPERQVGSSIIPAEDPDWKAVKKKALELSKKTRDLRVATHLTQALLNVDSFSGFCQGSALIVGLLEQHWSCVHPKLDPDDYNDPIFRLNTLKTLNELRLIQSIRQQALVSARGLGSFSLLDIERALAKPAKSKDDSIPDIALIEGAFNECKLESLTETTESVQGCIENINKINELLNTIEGVGIALSPDYGQLISALKDVEKALSERLVQRQKAEGIFVEEDNSTEAETEAMDTEAPNAMTTTVTTKAVSSLGAINNHRDVIRTLDALCKYYSENEPGSPVPLLLERAKRMVNKNFIEILTDLAPKGVNEAEHILGIDPKD